MTLRCLVCSYLAVVLILASVGCTSQPAQSATPMTADPSVPPHRAAMVCIEAAKALEAKGYYDQAIIQYERARRFQPQMTEIAHHLAILYDRQGNTYKALQEYQRALNNDPRNVQLINDLGYSFYNQGDYVQAEQWFRKALEIEPKYPRAWNNLAMTLGRQEKFDESLNAFKKIISDAAAHSNVGMLQAQAGHLEDAKKSLNYALQLDPTMPQAKAVREWINTQLAAQAAPIQIDPDAALQHAIPAPGQPEQPK